MRVPVSWLTAYCDPGLSTAEIADRLAAAGCEAERIERVGVASTAYFVVGKVLETAPHPNANRLRVCQVDDGSGAARTIVCGAPNVAAGQTVAIARPGAVMRDGRALGEAKLRGVVSSGMILAEDEVGVGEDHGGIMVLPDALVAGSPLAGALQIADDVLDLEIEPNRPDCLAVYGVARELHAVTAAPLADDPTSADAEPSGGEGAERHATIEIADPEVCLRFTGRVYEDVRIGPSPLWLKARLTAAGQRPISNVVDITNYVMLATGQPMHAFDLDRVRGGRIVVRRAEDGERMATLDGVERAFDGEMALVCDAEGPSSIAGIMGGEISEVSARTTRVLMEAATWVGPNILRTSSHLGLRSEASARFEKQLHPDQAPAAQRLAARLMVELCGARLAPGTLDAYPAPPEPLRIDLRLRRLHALLGERIPEPDVRAILGRLGFRVIDGREPGELEVTVPSFRDADVQREIDLVEEVVRVHGLARLPVTLPARRGAVGRLTRAGRLRRRLEDALRDRGLYETISYSFTAPATLARLRIASASVLTLSNPLSEDQSVMRPLLLPGLLDTARRNTARGRPGLALFESAHVYRPGPGEPPALERHHLSALIAGEPPGSWRGETVAADYYAIRAVLDGVLEGTGLEWHPEPEPEPEPEPGREHPYLHPGRSATVVAGGRAIGWLGEVHPLVAREWDLDRSAAFELDVDTLAEVAPSRPAAYREVPAYPAVVQDLAVVVPEAVAAAEVEDRVRAGAADLLESLSLFDVYRGEQVGAGNTSLTMRLELRAGDRTLTDDDATAVRGRIEELLATIGGRLRA